MFVYESFNQKDKPSEGMHREEKTLSMRLLNRVQPKQSWPALRVGSHSYVTTAHFSVESYVTRTVYSTPYALLDIKKMSMFAFNSLKIPL